MWSAIAIIAALLGLTIASAPAGAQQVLSPYRDQQFSKTRGRSDAEAGVPDRGAPRRAPRRPPGRAPRDARSAVRRPDRSLQRAPRIQSRLGTATQPSASLISDRVACTAGDTLLFERGW